MNGTSALVARKSSAVGWKTNGFKGATTQYHGSMNRLSTCSSDQMVREGLCVVHEVVSWGSEL